MHTIRIGPWLVDPADRSLSRDGQVTRLEPKVMSVLMLLADRQGSVVTHDELLRAVWPDAHVAPIALARSISVLRRVLGDAAKQPIYIETIPKRGYRLVASVGRGEERRPGAPPRSASTRAALTAAAVLLAALSWSDGTRGGRERARDPVPAGVHNRSRTGNESSVAYYRQAVANNPTSTDAHAGLATAYAFRTDYLPDRRRWGAAAIEEATRATALDPTSPSSIKALGTAYFKAGNLPRAIAEYRRALEIFPEDHRTRTNLGLVLMASGRVAEALPEFEQRIAREPNGHQGYMSLAEGLLLAGFPDQAAATARRALLLEPYAHAAQMLLVRADLVEGRFAEAGARLLRQLEVDPGCAQCAVQLGLIAQLASRVGDAERWYERAIEISPAFLPGSLRLAHLYTEQQRWTAGTALLERVTAIATDTIVDRSSASGAMWLLAAAASIRNDRPTALEWYQRAVAAGRRDFAWDRFDPLLATIRDDIGDRVAADRAAARPVVARLAQTMAAVDARFRRFVDPPGLVRPDRPGWPAP